MGSTSNLDQKCFGYLGCSCSRQVALPSLKKRKPRNSADRKHHIGQDQHLPQNPPQKNWGGLLTCLFQSRTLQPSLLLLPQIPRDTQSPLCPWEVTHSTLLLTATAAHVKQLSNAKGGPLSPCKTPDWVAAQYFALTHWPGTQLPHLLGPLLSMLLCSSEAMCSTYKKKEKIKANSTCWDTAQNQSLPASIPSSCSFTWLLIHPAPAIYGFPGQSSSKASTHRHTDQHYTQHHKQWDSRREKTLCKKNDSLTGDAVGQGDRQGRIGPEQGGSMVAPENQIRTECSVTRSYGQMEMMDVQEAHLQDLRASGFRVEVPQSIKMDQKREELLAQTGTPPQKRDARLIHTLHL